MSYVGRSLLEQDTLINLYVLVFAFSTKYHTNRLCNQEPFEVLKY